MVEQKKYFTFEWPLLGKDAVLGVVTLLPHPGSQRRFVGDAVYFFICRFLDVRQVALGFHFIRAFGFIEHCVFSPSIRLNAITMPDSVGETIRRRAESKRIISLTLKERSGGPDVEGGMQTDAVYLRHRGVRSGAYIVTSNEK